MLSKQDYITCCSLSIQYTENEGKRKKKLIHFLLKVQNFFSFRFQKKGANLCFLDIFGNRIYASPNILQAL